MKRAVWLWLLLVLTLGLRSVAGGLYKQDAPTCPVRITDTVWHDAARDRDVPVRIYMPVMSGQNSSGLPLVVFSHGLGGSGQMYGYFGKAMAERGFVVIAPTHHGSDTAALGEWAKKNGFGKKDKNGDGWLRTSISDPENLKNRPGDISFVIDRALQEPSLRDIVDVNRIGVAGHSFGAYTAMAMGGLTVELEGKKISFRDPRVKAVLPMSPEGAGVMGIGNDSWNDFAVPVLFLTGTNDYGSGGRAASWRREGFDHVKGVDSYLFTIAGATHMTFGGGGASVSGEGSGDSGVGGWLRAKIRDRVREKSAEKSGGMDKDVEEHVVLVKAYGVAFFDAYLNGKAGAKEWMKNYAAEKHEECAAEFRGGREPGGMESNR
ncbi:MAG: hypothetical protein U0573_12455 [Phycisphaerales bacterium]|nr:hypothetical protein [Planctomycetota bacterium]